MAAFSLALPTAARCERPSGASDKACNVNVGGLAQGPDENRGFAGRDRVDRGLAHVEQGRTVFAGLTVEENLRVATAGPVDEVYNLFPELERRRRLPAGRLSGGEQQMLVIGRALLMAPTMLMVDEISLGLAPVVIRRLVPVVRVLAERGVGVLMVEQFATIALRVADRAVVLDRGEVVYDGDPAGLEQRSELLHGAYLGQRDASVPRREELS